MGQQPELTARVCSMPAAAYSMKIVQLIGIALVDQARIGLKARDGEIFVGAPIQIVGLRAAALPARFCLMNDSGDLVVAALGGQRQRAGRVPMGVDAGAGIGAMFHQQLHHLRIPPQYGYVDGALLAVFGSLQIDDLGTPHEQIAHGRAIAVLYRIAQAAGRHTVDVSFQLGPTMSKP